MYRLLERLPSSSKSKARVCVSSCRVARACVNLWEVSREPIVLMREFMYSWRCFLAFVARAISSPRITHLCASQREVGEISGFEFSVKYCWILVRTWSITRGSLRREGFRRQIFVLELGSGKDKVTVIGWWSDKNIGSMVDCWSRGRSVWERKKKSILEYFWCGAEKRYNPCQRGIKCAMCHVRSMIVVVDWSDVSLYKLK